MRVSGARWLASLGVPVAQIQSMARWSSAIVARYVGDAVLETLSGHVKRARRITTAVGTIDPLGPDLSQSGPGPLQADPDEEAVVAALLDGFASRLQHVEAAVLNGKSSSRPVVVNLRSGAIHLVAGDHSNSSGEWRAICGFRYGGLACIRFGTEPPEKVNCGTCLSVAARSL